MCFDWAKTDVKGILIFIMRRQLFCYVVNYAISVLLTSTSLLLLFLIYVDILIASQVVAS